MPPIARTGVGTPFGAPVVPEVKIMMNGASPLKLSAAIPGPSASISPATVASPSSA
jgi:hypothetical protein